MCNIDAEDLKLASSENVRRLARSMGLAGKGDIKQVCAEVLRKLKAERNSTILARGAQDRRRKNKDWWRT